MALNKGQVVSLGLGAMFIIVALGLMGYEGIANLDKTPLFLLFGVTILAVEVGYKNWTDNRWTFVEIVTLVIMATISIYAISLMFGMPIPQDWLTARLVPWVVLIQGAQIAWQGYMNK